MSHRVLVVGGGLAGLFTATRLQAASQDVVVLEASPNPGGLVRSIHRDGFTLEPAAGTMLLPHPHLGPLLDDLGISVQPTNPHATGRHVFTGDRLVAIPSSPRALLSPVVPWGGRLRGIVEPFVRRRAQAEDETLADFMRRRLGRRLGSMAAWLMASGVFAGDPERLSAEAAFPSVTGLERDTGSLFRGAVRRMRQRPSGAPRPTSHVPSDDMSAIADGAASVLGDRLRTRFRVSAIHRGDDGTWRVEGPETLTGDHVVLAVEPAAAGVLLPDLRPLLGRARTAPVAVVGLGADEDRLPLPVGFGALTGPDTHMATRGVLFESSYAPHRSPPGQTLAKVVAGGVGVPDLTDLDDTDLTNRIVDEVARILSADLSPTFVEVVRHRIPQYEMGHQNWLRALDSALDGRPGLHLTGWGYRGVGVAQIASDAVTIEGRIATG